jgi:hypothetical protein
MIRGTQCPNGIKESNKNDQANDANEFDMIDLSNPIRRVQFINSEKISFSKKGRSKPKEMKLIG